jgi:predicted  nucleic acid-binding Zn-ribbon protein
MMLRRRCGPQNHEETNAVLEELAALIKLAQIDTSKHDLEAELGQAPERLKENQTDLKRLQDLLDAERKQVEEAVGLLEAQEEEIKEQGQSLARSKSKSAKARTMREIEAVERELETIRRSMREREEERERLKSAIEQRKAIVTQHEQELKELAVFVATEEQTTVERIERLKKEKSDVLAGREDAVSKISPVILKRYDLIRSRRGGSAAVQLKEDMCGGCFMIIPPQLANAIRTGDTLEQCPRCQRFLYPPDAPEKPSEGTPGTANGTE